MLNIQIERVAIGSLPLNFHDHAKRITFKEDGRNVIFEREDVDAIDGSNINLLNDAERAIMHELNMAFALHPQLQSVILEPEY